MKILITGTHFTPAQATVEELKKYPDIKLVYLGRKYTREGDSSPSLESQVLPKLGVKFIPIVSGRLQRSFTFYTLPSLLKIPIGFIQSFYYLIKESPDVILSFGGYLAVPVVICGWLLSIPIIIHEQTLVSGLANRISAFFASKIAISFSEHKLSKSNKSVLTGNPLRAEIINPPLDGPSPLYQKFITEAKSKHLPLVFITGGNQGSHIINEKVAQILPQLTKIAYIIHQTGDSKYKDFEKLIIQKETLASSDHYMVSKWIDGRDLGGIMSGTDVVVSRAGMNTLLELAYYQIPTLLIPLPYLSFDEQNINAHFFKSLGLAQILPQKELTSEVLISEIEKMLANLPNLKKEAQGASKIIIADAAKRLALETVILVKPNV